MLLNCGPEPMPAIGRAPAPRQPGTGWSCMAGHACAADPFGTQGSAQRGRSPLAGTPGVTSSSVMVPPRRRRCILAARWMRLEKKLRGTRRLALSCHGEITPRLGQKDRE